ncbi:uncharacterized protein LOC122030427 [Zingiber officinale]|uniref:uncharacterized protein LOC122030427 n=1 Tax=Zingiber officinale TaxID=94328 RepID=UPI001C4AD904|nr:uncharacterized protein LOC122030427 [Zingiber officinale]
MGRENNHHRQTVAQSSIVLLQERFRQLQRVKAMREEREQLRARSQGERSSPDADQCVQPMWFNHAELVRPSMPLRGTPTCWLDNRGDRTDLQALQTSLSINLWPSQATSRHPVTCTEQDVDTTLHL